MSSKNKIYWFSLVPATILLLMHVLCFKVSIPLSERFAILTYVPKIPAIDDLIPVIPTGFIVIYIGAYLFWWLCPVINSMAERSRYADYVVGFALAYIIGGIWLSLFPATMDRVAEGLYTNAGGIFNRMHQWFITEADSGEIAHGLLPSFHTMSSIFCYLGVAKCKEIPKGLRIFILIYALGVVASTLFLKQHYVMDAVSGTTLAVVCYFLSRKFHFGKVIEPVLKKFDKRG